MEIHIDADSPILLFRIVYIKEEEDGEEEEKDVEKLDLT